MILYVDETENEEFFIVTGLLLRSREDTQKAYKHFKKEISSFPIQAREKSILYTEFKSTILDRRYKRIKYKMLEALGEIAPCVIYSCYIKKGAVFTQAFKEETYLTLLSKIVACIDDDISVVIDAFNKRDFEERIEDRILSYPNVQAVMPRDSQKEAGLQFVDNLCSVIRLKKSETDTYDFFTYIEQWIIEV